MTTLQALQRSIAPLATLSIIVLGPGLGALQAETAPAAGMPVQMVQPVRPAPGFSPVKCANPSVTLTATKERMGIVRLRGTVTNDGLSALDVPLQVMYVMNVSYPPKTYNQVGISEQLCTRSLDGLAIGHVVTVDCSYQIPDFAEWIPDRPAHLPTRPPAQPTDAKRLFTLAVVRTDMAPFTPVQDCNPADTQASVELSYRTPAPAKPD
jgi:hypothetical protein